MVGKQITWGMQKVAQARVMFKTLGENKPGNAKDREVPHRPRGRRVAANYYPHYGAERACGVEHGMMPLSMV
jgi:hypothetical protein